MSADAFSSLCITREPKVSARQPCTSKTDFDMKYALKVTLLSVIGRQGVAYRHVILLAISLNVSEEVATQIAIAVVDNRTVI